MSVSRRVAIALAPTLGTPLVAFDPQEVSLFPFDELLDQTLDTQTHQYAAQFAPVDVPRQTILHQPPDLVPNPLGGRYSLHGGPLLSVPIQPGVALGEGRTIPAPTRCGDPPGAPGE